MRRTIMNVKKVIKSIQNEFKHISFTLDDDSNDNTAMLIAGLTVTDYDDGIRLEILVSDTGYLSLQAIFDELQESFDVYKMINEFNQNVSFLHAFLEARGKTTFLCLSKDMTNVDNEKNALETVVSFLSTLLDDDTKKYLLPLTKMTESTQFDDDEPISK